MEACHADGMGPCVAACCPLKRRKPKPMIAYCPPAHQTLEETRHGESLGS